MQERDNHYFHPLVIFNRLFNFIINFIMNTLIARGLKRIILGRPVSHGSTHEEEEEEAIDGSLSSRGNTKDGSSSEIVVDFKHGIELENWTSMEKIGSSVHFSADEASPILGGGEKGNNIKHEKMEKDTGSSNKELPQVQDHKNGVSNGTPLSQLVQEKSGLNEIEPVSTDGVRARVSKRVVCIGDAAEEREKNKKKEKNIAIESEKAVRMNSPRHVKPVLMSVAVNINEKSDEFIRSRKEAMRRNYNHA